MDRYYCTDKRVWIRASRIVCVGIDVAADVWTKPRGKKRRVRVRIDLQRAKQPACLLHTAQESIPDDSRKQLVNDVS